MFKPKPALRQVISHPRQQGFSILELLMVVVVIGILIITAYRYLQDHIVEAEKTALTSLSRDFAVSMSMLRNKWIVEGRRINPDGQRATQLDENTLYLNKNGWPFSTSPRGNGGAQAAKNCAQLWQVIMQYSVETTVEGESLRGKTPYHISTPSQGICRYELAHLPENTSYFDYLVKNGEVTLNIKQPAIKQKYPLVNKLRRNTHVTH